VGPQELHDLCFSAAGLFSASNTIIMCIDLGLVGERYLFWAGVFQILGLCCILYIRYDNSCSHKGMCKKGWLDQSLALAEI
jgi:predicted permease